MSLPCELVSEILSRLQGKSLMRFKSVDRSWNTLFNTNSFIRNQKEKHMRSSSSDEDRFIHFNSETEYSSKTEVIVFSTCDPPELQSLEYPRIKLEGTYRPIKVFGHCNGIYCLNGEHIIDDDFSTIEETFLWNPTTKDVKVIPPNPFFEAYSGFGSSDPNSFGHFKLVQFGTTSNENDGSFVVKVHLYDCDTDSWSIIPDDSDLYDNVDDRTKLKYEIRRCGAYSNGVYYWLSNDFTYIISFDFRSNKFQTIETPSILTRATIPHDMDILFEVYCDMIEANNSIAFIDHDTRDEYERTEIWSLKQEEGRWIKLYSIAYPNCHICGILEDSTEFLVGLPYDFFKLYNSRGELLYEITSFCIEDDLSIYPYVETIAPLSL